MGWATFLADFFFTNSSGHTGREQPFANDHSYFARVFEIMKFAEKNRIEVCRIKNELSFRAIYHRWRAASRLNERTR
jgi:hypothetical protein